MGLCSAKNIDMPRVVRFKPRKKKSSEHKVDKKCRIGRTYDDFLNFKENNNDIAIVETDTVIGRIGGKTLLTIHFKICDFMLAFLLEKNTSQAVIDVYNDIYNKIGRDTFIKLFPVLLTDNGSEFSNPLKIEKTDDNIRRTMLFYCNPSSPYQKPNVELNHEFIRRVLPKGSSFDTFTQQDINLMMSHINSYSREKLNNKSPIFVFSQLFGCKLPALFGISEIPANQVILSRQLFN